MRFSGVTINPQWHILAANPPSLLTLSIAISEQRPLHVGLSARQCFEAGESDVDGGCWLKIRRCSNAHAVRVLKAHGRERDAYVKADNTTMTF
jgi:hypothetical protein